MRVLGVDPGLVTTGYGVLEQTGGSIRLVEAGTINSGGPERPLGDRLRTLYTELSEMIADHSPDEAALEQLYSHYEHPRTAILMGHARGVICLAASMSGIPLHHYTAGQVKSAVTGNGRASKDQIQQMVRRTFSLPVAPNPPDVADAVAIAMTHLYRRSPTVAQFLLRR